MGVHFVYIHVFLIYRSAEKCLDGTSNPPSQTDVLFGGLFNNEGDDNKYLGCFIAVSLKISLKLCHLFAVTCHGCGEKSSRVEKFIDVPVAVMGMSSLGEALGAHFLLNQYLTGENKYRCDHCSKVNKKVMLGKTHSKKCIFSFRT